MKTKVGLLYGGMSGEHDVSKLSANSVLRALDLNKYDVLPIAIDREGNWYLNDCKTLLAEKTQSLSLTTNARLVSPTAVPSETAIRDKHPLASVDVFLPILHGPLYEDGCLQGLFELMNKAYVGPSVACSAIGMDKIFAKKLVMQAGISVAPFCFITAGMSELVQQKVLEVFLKTHSFPFFVKPAAMGSSVGISKVRTSEELKSACKEALQYDEKVLIEQGIVGQEVEVALLGELGVLQASIAGEIKLKSATDFYSYDAKYLDEQAIELLIPANIPEATLAALQETSVDIGNVLEVEGMARVDYFIDANGAILFNEINTLPGFTKYSMYPKLWEHSGLQYRELLDRLIECALSRHRRRQTIKRDRI